MADETSGTAGIKLPSAPLSLQDQGKLESMRFGAGVVQLIETILDDKTAQRKLETSQFTEIWIPLMKSLKLTFLNDVDAAILYLQFEEAVLDVILCRRRGGFSLKDSLLINQLRMLFRANVKRSVGSTPDTLNERILQATSISHSTGTYREPSGKGISGRIAGLFGRGKNV